MNRQLNQKKAAPSSKPGKWDKPLRTAHVTKAGPGRKAKASANSHAPRTMVAPMPLKKLRANIGGNRDGFDVVNRRIWREGEPMHIVRPVRAARIAAKSEAT